MGLAMKAPTDRKYSETHEWFLVDDNVVTIGITQHAADELTDITYVDLPEVGKSFAAGDPIGEVESVKATSEIFTAVPGRVVEVNTALMDRPELVNEDAFDEGWMIRLKVDALDQLRSLMDAKEYKSFVRNAG
jgi:glycine cleavage system H protein